ncbi:hypothetical protein T12_516 [Trichinella patagoniensis]|uniref:Uncharacterized protein n=1 Tax=Trichinella patagoniensis TaxID=990121 RepID=A0A0V0ZL44_9BILA|nr:hypothetical protein T12_516 [Trichinella patagoniensis]
MNDRERKIENRADEEDHAIHFECLSGHILLCSTFRAGKFVMGRNNEHLTNFTELCEPFLILD